jgi:hypothetical protein
MDLAELLGLIKDTLPMHNGKMELSMDILELFGKMVYVRYLNFKMVSG